VRARMQDGAAAFTMRGRSPRMEHSGERLPSIRVEVNQNDDPIDENQGGRACIRNTLSLFEESIVTMLNNCNFASHLASIFPILLRHGRAPAENKAVNVSDRAKGGAHEFQRTTLDQSCLCLILQVSAPVPMPRQTNQ